MIDGNGYLPVTRCAAVEEDGVGVVDHLVEREARIVLARREGRITSLVAHLELRRLSHGVVVRVPHEVDHVTRLRVDEWRQVAEDARRRRNNDGVDSTSARISGTGRRRWCPLWRRGAELRNAFWLRELAWYHSLRRAVQTLTVDAVIIAIAAPAHASGTICHHGTVRRAGGGVVCCGARRGAVVPVGRAGLNGDIRRARARRIARRVRRRSR